jgi:hypothetical protein
LRVTLCQPHKFDWCRLTSSRRSPREIPGGCQSFTDFLDSKGLFICFDPDYRDFLGDFPAVMARGLGSDRSSDAISATF